MATAISITSRWNGRVTIPSEMMRVVAPAGGCAAFARIINAPVDASDSAAAPTRASRDAGGHRRRRVLQAEQPQRAVAADDADRVPVDRVPRAGGRRARREEEQKRGRAERGKHERRAGHHRDRRQQRDRDEAVQKHEQRPDRALRIARQQVRDLEPCGKARA